MLILKKHLQKKYAYSSNQSSKLILVVARRYIQENFHASNRLFTKKFFAFIKELDKLIMEAVNAMQDSESEDEPEVESEPETKRKSAAKRKPIVDDSDGSDYKPKKKAPARKKKRGSSDDDDSDEDWRETKKKNKKGGPAKATGFTRPYKLSPELSELMGADELPRHEVVKQVWKIIKEKNLYDPKNKQYAICDEQLEKVIGVKRFRTFGMMKYLMPHFIK